MCFLADNLDNCFDPRGEQFRLLTIEEFVNQPTGSGFVPIHRFRAK